MIISKRNFRILILSFLVPATACFAQNPNDPAGTIAPDAIRLDVDNMSRFFGKYAVITKSQAEALINDKGETVIPFNTARFGTEVVNSYGTGNIGRKFYDKSYYAALSPYRHDISYTQLIPFLDIKSNREGYINSSGEKFFRKVSNTYPSPFWLGIYDDYGYANRFAYTNLTTDDGLLVSDKYDGTSIVGRGNYKRMTPKAVPVQINYSFGEYSTASTTKRLNASKGIWTNDLTPASYLDWNVETKTTDPVKILAAKNNAVGFINRKGEFQIKPGYYSVSEFSEGVSFVSKINEFNELSWGAIDTLGRQVIPFKFKMHPGRFSYGLSIIKARDLENIDYGFINKKGEILFTLPKKNGDTLEFSLGLNNEFHDQDYPLHYGYDGFYFMEGYQFVRLTFKEDEGYNKTRSELFLMDTLRRFIPIEKMLEAKLPSKGRVEIISGIRDGQFLYKYTRSLYATGIRDEEGETDALGIADIHGNIILPPRFQKLTLFDKESELQYAQAGKVGKYSALGAEGYIDRKGVFRIVKEKAKGGF